MTRFSFAREHTFCLTAPQAGVVYWTRPAENVDWVSPEKATFCIKEADMWRRRKALVRLQNELNTLALFDRVHDYTQDHNLAESRAHALRQIRRTQIMSEIEELRRSKLEYRNRARISSAILLLGAGGYTTLHYLLR